MSLKAIKDMLEQYRRSIGHVATAGAVEAEIAALSRAAQTLCLHKPQESEEEWDSARSIMARIAEEATGGRHD